MKIHLHQFLSKTGLFNSKNDMLEAVKNSEIKVGNNIITNPMFRFNRKKNNVYWKGTQLKYINKKTYIILNKPEGYISARLSKADKKLGKKSVFDLIKIDENKKNTLFCVGRLDEDTSGLLVITNDGKLGFRIAEPKNKISKTYEVILDKQINEEQIKKIENGVIIKLEIDGKITDYKTMKCKIIPETNKKLKITIEEGKKREIRRIFESFSNEVMHLKRIAIAKIKLDELKLKKREYKLVNKEYILKRLK